MLTLVAVLILGFLAERNLLIFAPLQAEFDFSRPSGWISFLKPRGRVSEIKEEAGKFYQSIVGEPIYIESNIPLSFFKKAEIVLNYKNPEQDILELGLVTKNGYDLRPLQNKVLDDLSWPKICADGVCLWQKEKKYESIGDFMENQPAAEKIGVYYYELGRPYRLPDYKPSERYQSFNYSLRGAHQFYTYIKDEDLDFMFTFEDMNRSVGADEVEVNLYNEENNLVKNWIMTDDGNSEANEVVVTPRQLKLNIGDLSEGVYRLEISASDDIFLRDIQTRQKYLSFIGEIYLGDNINSTVTSQKDATLFGNSREVAAVTTHDEGRQTLSFTGENLFIEKTHIQYYYKNSAGNFSVRVPVSDILLQGDGLWSFSEKNFFDPRQRRVADSRDLEGLNFVIARYQPLASNSEWQTRGASFNLYNARKEKGKVRFIISAPGLTADKKPIDVRGIIIRINRGEFSRENFTKFLNKFFYE